MRAGTSVSLSIMLHTTQVVVIVIRCAAQRITITISPRQDEARMQPETGCARRSQDSPGDCQIVLRLRGPNLAAVLGSAPLEVALVAFELVQAVECVLFLRDR